MRVYTTILSILACYVLICSSQDSTNTRLGLLASQLGVAPVPGVGSQQPGQQNFPPNSGGGVFNQPNNFNPAGFQNSVNGNLIQGSSGNRGCFCHPGNQVCPPGASRRTKRSAQLSGVRIANVVRPGQECPGQQVCCTGGVNSPVINAGPGPVGPVIQQNCGRRELRAQNNPDPTQASRTSFGEFPWMAVILGTNDNFYQGGGALISANYILTAAHKVNKFRQQPQRLKIRVGDHNVATAQDHPSLRHEEIVIQRIILHPQFNINNLHNDVALLQLSRPVNHQIFPHIGPVCLPEQGQLFSPQRCWVTGWGEDAFGSGNFDSILKKVDVPIWDPFVCEQRLRQQPRLGSKFNLDKTSFLCAGGEQGKDACSGDGGAPLVCEGSNGRFSVVGLVAWGIGCANEIPGVYVNVANYANFIRQQTGISL